MAFSIKWIIMKFSSSIVLGFQMGDVYEIFTAAIILVSS